MTRTETLPFAHMPHSWDTLEEHVAEGIDMHVTYLTELVECVDYPCELHRFNEVADDDPGFEDAFDDWVGFVSQTGLMLALQRCCDKQGLLRPHLARFDALEGLPEASMGKLKFFFRACPLHVQHLVAHWVSWMVRFEALQRDRPGAAY